MVSIEDYKKDLEKLGEEYFINTLSFVGDISSWAKENNADLGEPHLPMKLMVGPDDNLTMVIQSDTEDDLLSDVIRNLGLRWSVKDNVTDVEKKLNSSKKQLVYCFLKEYTRALNKVDGGALSEDEWVLEEMEYLGYFNE
jgi:hypothetical protein